VQPDAQIRRVSDGMVFGDDVYGRFPPSDQIRKHTIAAGADWSFAVQVQNDGQRTDDITVTASAILQPPDIKVRYFAGWFDVTASVTGTGFTFADVPPGGIRKLPVQFRASPGASVGSRAVRNVTFTSGTAPVIDRVQLDVDVVAPT
jgi:hypothetical protein